MNERISVEVDAIRTLLKWCELAEEVRSLHERANLPIPEQLKRFLGQNGTGKRAVEIPPPERSSWPPGHQAHWLSVEAESAGATSLFLAALRRAKGPVALTDLVPKVIEMNKETASGSLWNVAKKLEEKKLIRRLANGKIELIEPGKAPVIYNGFLWGPQDVFVPKELAVHRREGIVQILRQVGPLATFEIFNHLKNCRWVNAPKNKDLVKGDLAMLEQDGKIGRVAGSKKWELVQESGADVKKGHP